MPYKSEAQRRMMHREHPEIAARWDKEYPNQGSLPEHVAPKPKSKPKKKRRKRARKTPG